jgi:large subunit ribosomal protein L5
VTDETKKTRAPRPPKAQASSEAAPAPKEKKAARAKAQRAEAPAADAMVMAEASEAPAAAEAPAIAESAAVEVSEMTEAPAAADAAAEVPAAAAAEKPTTRRDRGGSRKGSAAPVAEPGPASAALRTDGLRGKYYDDVVAALQKEFGYSNPMQVPRLAKIVVNIGLGEALTNAKALDAAVGDLASITGQKPIVTKARRSIAQFKVRTGNPIGAKVTLRGQRMWDFLERLTRLALPRIRDFRGVPGKSFDGRGNYSLGLREQLAFPEIDYDKIDRLRGLEVSIVTTAHSDEESKRLLQLLGMPFAS